MKIIVTGGAGFIGSNIVEELVMLGHQVKVIDNLSTGKRENLSKFINQIEFNEGDIRDLDYLQKEFQGWDHILHQAALPSVHRSIIDPIGVNQTNIDGTLNILVAARDQNIKRVVYASSSSIYGDALAEYKHEDLPADPLSPYALAKYAGETYCRLFYKLYGLETVCLRYFNVFGPRQNPDSQYAAAIPKFIMAILNGQPPTIFGDGEQSRDFTYVKNNVQANILALQTTQGLGEVINIACGESFSLNQVINLINQELKTSVAPVYQPSHPGDIKHSKADITKARQLLGYQPIVSFPNGLKETIKWCQTKISSAPVMK